MEDKERKASRKRGEQDNAAGIGDFQTGYTYSFSFHSMYIDMAQVGLRPSCVVCSGGAPNFGSLAFVDSTLCAAFYIHMLSFSSSSAPTDCVNQRTNPNNAARLNTADRKPGQVMCASLTRAVHALP